LGDDTDEQALDVRHGFDPVPGDRLDTPTHLAAAPILVFVDEPDHVVRLAVELCPKKCAAAFKMSLAQRSSAFSRFSRFSSAS